MTEVDDNRARLKKFYAHYGVQKTDDDTEKALQMFAGKFPKMWSMLELKYGPESAVTGHQLEPSNPKPIAASANEEDDGPQTPRRNNGPAPSNAIEKNRTSPIRNKPANRVGDDVAPPSAGYNFGVLPQQPQQYQHQNNFNVGANMPLPPPPENFSVSGGVQGL